MAELTKNTNDPIITCWCGAKGTYNQLYNVDGLDFDCGKTGLIYCFCGGDQCVCHFHGQAQECPGCGSCDEDKEQEDED